MQHSFNFNLQHLARRTDQRNACPGKSKRRSLPANSNLAPLSQGVFASRDKTSPLSREISAVASEISWRDFRGIPPRPRGSRKHAEELGNEKRAEGALVGCLATEIATQLRSRTRFQLLSRV